MRWSKSSKLIFWPRKSKHSVLLFIKSILAASNTDEYPSSCTLETMLGTCSTGKYFRKYWKFSSVIVDSFKT